MIEDGWEFWIDDDGLVRLIMVAERDFQKAEQIAKSQLSGGRVISYQEIPKRVISFVKLQSQETIELVPVEPKDKLIPRGTTRGGLHDNQGN